MYGAQGIKLVEDFCVNGACSTGRLNEFTRLISLEAVKLVQPKRRKHVHLQCKGSEAQATVELVASSCVNNDDTTEDDVPEPLAI